MIFKHWSEISESAWPYRFFKPNEIACHGTGELGMNNDALVALDNFRGLLGSPVSLSSAYRSAYHNAKIGGAPLSSHTTRGSNGSTAFDVKLMNYDKATLRDIAERVGFKGFGMRYNTFIHIDMGRRRSW